MNFQVVMGRVFVLVIVALFCLVGRAQNVAVTIEDPLGRAIQATGAEVCRSYTTGCVSLKDDAIEPDEARLILTDAAASFGIAVPEIEVQESLAQKCFKVSYSDMERQIVIAVRRLNDGDKKKHSPELLIHIIQQNPLHTDIAKINCFMTKFLQKFNKMPQISTCLEGVLDGKLRKDEKELCLQDAADAIGVEIVDRMEDSLYMTYTGYTSLLSNHVVTNGKRVNFHIAMRYHSFDNKTYISIGSPLITVAY